MPDVAFPRGGCTGVFVPLAGAPRLELPLDQVRVSAGFPSPAADYEDKRLDINEYLVRNPVSTFFFCVEGDSMEGAEIFHGDVLVVDKSIRARHGHIVIAFVDGQRLVKRLYQCGGRVALLAENPAYPPLEIREGMDFTVLGGGHRKVQALWCLRSSAVPVFALVDANNFYASCEKLFDPQLCHRPVVVLSNNDGCVVARSAEVKALGIPMGAPWFKLKEEARRHGIVAFSSNYALYADISNRVVEILSSFTPNLEVYSIDESFLELSGFERVGYQEYGAQIRQRVADWLGMAVCVGIGPTKTLAKLANHCAKKQLAGAEGVCDLTRLPAAEQTPLFSRIEVGEVWGVGRKIAARLEAMGIRTVQQLRDADAETLRSNFSVVLERTVRELRGVSCLALEEIVPERQQIMSSRSFGTLIYDLEDLEEAVASYIARAAEKLRAQDSLAGALQVYLRTNIFKPEVPQYQRAVTVPLPEASADTRVLTHWALRVLRRIYRPGFGYHKAGITLLDIVPRGNQQLSLFSAGNSTNGGNLNLMRTLDSINGRYGRGTLRLAAEGVAKTWQMRRGNLSPRYTTDWECIPSVRAC